MKRCRYVFIIVLFFLSSCVKEGDVQVTDVEYFGLSSPSKPDITVAIDNSSCHKIQIKSAKLDFYKNGERFLKVLLIDKMVMPKCSETIIDLPVRISASDPLTAMGTLSDWRSDPHGITITGEVVAKAGMGRKKIKLRDVPISQFLSTFDAE